MVLGGREGFSAQAVFDALQPEELLQSGIVLPIAAVTPTGATTGALLAQWLSTAYIALAQVRKPVQASSQNLTQSHHCPNYSSGLPLSALHVLRCEA